MAASVEAPFSLASATRQMPGTNNETFSLRPFGDERSIFPLPPLSLMMDIAKDGTLEMGGQAPPPDTTHPQTGNPVIRKRTEAFHPFSLSRRLRARIGTLLRKTNRVWYWGRRFKCPFCGANLRSLLPRGLHHPVLEEKEIIGGGYRVNSTCPVCLSYDRERLLILFLRTRTSVFDKPTKLLHVAPEPQVEKMLRAAQTVEYLTADLYEENVMVIMDITDIHYPEGTFDAVICNHVLEHLPDDRKAMAEIYRVLKPGGWAILQVPISKTLKDTYEDFSIVDERERERAFGQADHSRIYGQDYLARLAGVGYEVEEFSWAEDPIHFGGEANRYSLLPDEKVYFATKPTS